jgi:hypothetical protein
MTRHYPDQSVVNLGDSFNNPMNQPPIGSRNALDVSLNNMNPYGTDLGSIQPLQTIPQNDLTVVHSLDISQQHNSSGVAAGSTFWPSQLARDSNLNQKSSVMQSSQFMQDQAGNSGNMLQQLQQKYAELDQQYQKDKRFYDDALEVRTN